MKYKWKVNNNYVKTRKNSLTRIECCDNIVDCHTMLFVKEIMNALLIMAAEYEAFIESKNLSLSGSFKEDS